MGVMRFLIPPAEPLEDRPEAYRAYLSGADGRIFPTRVEIADGMMICRRTGSESGRLHVAWPIPGYGRPVISTGSLMEREEPYLLVLELTRGKLVQVRNQLAAWEQGGMEIPAGVRASLAEGQRLFARAAPVQERPEESSRLAREALLLACQAADWLTAAYTAQALEHRHRRYSQLPTSLGCSLGEAVPTAAWGQEFCDAFQAAVVPFEWRRIEPREGSYNWDSYDAQLAWCDQHRLLIRGGPLLDFAPDGLPAWLWQWEHDYFNLQSFVCDFVETAISRYVGRVRLWEVAARVNTGGVLALNEENRLMLTARVLDVARQVDEESQLFIRIDQPWGDYQARGQHRLSPLQFVDALIRSGVGLSGVNLEIAVDYRPRGTLARDPLEFSRLIDQWSVLGIPLFVTLAFPSDTGPDPRAHADLEVEPHHWRLPCSEEAQAAWIDLHLPLLIAKPAVVGVIWTHFSDAEPHEFPHAGLLRPDQTPKPALHRIIAHRLEHWKR